VSIEVTIARSRVSLSTSVVATSSVFRYLHHKSSSE